MNIKRIIELWICIKTTPLYYSFFPYWKREINAKILIMTRKQKPEQE